MYVYKEAKKKTKTDQIRYTYVKTKEGNTQIHLYTNTSSLLFPPLRPSLFSVTNHD